LRIVIVIIVRFAAARLGLAGTARVTVPVAILTALVLNTLVLTAWFLTTGIARLVLWIFLHDPHASVGRKHFQVVDLAAVALHRLGTDYFTASFPLNPSHRGWQRLVATLAVGLVLRRLAVARRLRLSGEGHEQGKRDQEGAGEAKHGGIVTSLWAAD